MLNFHDTNHHMDHITSYFVTEATEITIDDLRAADTNIQPDWNVKCFVLNDEFSIIDEPGGEYYAVFSDPNSEREVQFLAGTSVARTSPAFQECNNEESNTSHNSSISPDLLEWANGETQRIREESSMNIHQHRPLNGCIMCADDPSFCNPSFCDAALERQNHGCTGSNMCGSCDTCREWAGDSDSDPNNSGYYDLCDGTDVCGCSGCVAEHVICQEHRTRIAICGCAEPTDPEESEEWLDDAPDNEELDNDPRYQTGQQGRSLLVPCEYCGSVHCTAGSRCLTDEPERQDTIADHDVITDQNRHLFLCDVCGLVDTIQVQFHPGRAPTAEELGFSQFAIDEANELNIQPNLNRPAHEFAGLHCNCEHHEEAREEMRDRQQDNPTHHIDSAPVTDPLEGTPNRHNTASWEHNTSPNKSRHSHVLNSTNLLHKWRCNMRSIQTRIIGHITDDPIVDYYPCGLSGAAKPRTRFTIALNMANMPDNNLPNFLKVEAYGNQGEYIANNCARGSRLEVTGTIREKLAIINGVEHRYVYIHVGNNGSFSIDHRSIDHRSEPRGNTASWQAAVDSQINPQPCDELDNLLAEIRGESHV